MDYETFQNQTSIGGKIRNALLALFIIIVLPALVIWFLAWATGALRDGSSKSEVAASTGIDRIEALVLCQQNIKRLSINPNTAEVPRANAIDNGETWRFLWNNDSGLQLQNQFGAMIGVFGACSVDKATGKITNLRIDGETII